MNRQPKMHYTTMTISETANQEWEKSENYISRLAPFVLAVGSNR